MARLNKLPWLPTLNVKYIQVPSRLGMQRGFGKEN